MSSREVRRDPNGKTIFVLQHFCRADSITKNRTNAKYESWIIITYFQNVVNLLLSQSILNDQVSYKANFFSEPPI